MLTIVRVATILFFAISATNGAQVEFKLQTLIDQNGIEIEPLNIVIRFAQGTDSVLEQFSNREFSTREERLNTVAFALEQHASSTQEPVLRVLNELALTSPELRIRPFWISNLISVRGANGKHVQALLDRCSDIIADIRLEKVLPLPVIEREERTTCSSAPTSDTWGTTAINVRAAWSLLGGSNGEGITVSHIDTGVRWTHVALQNNFRGGNYSWYDPQRKVSLPYDSVGHGTHTMATIAGSPYIGVAPKAQWISCQGCRPNGCTEADLNACGQWILCPTHPDGETGKDCSKAPNLVSNSWGTPEDDDFYQPIVKAWVAANIFPIFSIGNAGPNCSTAGSPGGYVNVLGVGAAQLGTTSNSFSLAKFSSRGPVPSRPSRIKPDLSAPGQSITSAWINGDNCYNTISGTSMAAPHVAGVVALMLSANPNLSYNTIRTNLIYGCTNSNLDTSNLSPCETTNPPEPPFKYPNNEFGQGLVNARRSVVRIQAL